MAPFDWHGAPLTRETPVGADYRGTQNVRRFLRSQCGEDFLFDRLFMAWIRNGQPKTLGEVADEWLRRNAGSVSTAFGSTISGVSASSGKTEEPNESK